MAQNENRKPMETRVTRAVRVFSVRAVAFIALMALVMGSCAGIAVTTPQGFAHYTKDTGMYRAISADGVRLKARRFENKPYGDLAMWQDAMGNHFTSLGYRELATGVLDAPEGYAARYAEYQSIYNGRSHRYIAALYVGKGDIVIIEAAGEEPVYLKRREALMKSITAFNPRG